MAESTFVTILGTRSARFVLAASACAGLLLGGVPAAQADPVSPSHSAARTAAAGGTPATARAAARAAKAAKAAKAKAKAKTRAAARAKAGSARTVKAPAKRRKPVKPTPAPRSPAPTPVSPAPAAPVQAGPAPVTEAPAAPPQALVPPSGATAAPPAPGTSAPTAPALAPTPPSAPAVPAPSSETAVPVRAGSGFVTRSGNQLRLDGKPYRFAGANMYWLGLDDNIRDAHGPTYPSHRRIDAGFDTAVAMQAGVVRAHTLGISVGCQRCLQPAPDRFNDAAFEPIDYAIASAARHGVKLMIPLTDQWHWYHGGKHTFTSWNGHPNIHGTSLATSAQQREIEAKFYTDPAVVEDFRAYVAHLLDHRNQYTGVALKDDPTIMAWETGNEIWDAPPSWTQGIAGFIKRDVGARQLVADGTAASGMRTENAAVHAPDVDILGGHFYSWPSGLDTSWMGRDAAVARQHDKAYIVGEYAWSRGELPGFLSAVQGDRAVAGAMPWTIVPHAEDGSQVPHGSTTMGDDDVSLHLPATSPAMQQSIERLTAHGAAMSGS